MQQLIVYLYSKTSSRMQRKDGQGDKGRTLDKDVFVNRM